MSEPAAVIVVEPGTPAERTVPVTDRLFVGRECVGIDDAHRLVGAHFSPSDLRRHGRPFPHDHVANGGAEGPD